VQIIKRRALRAGSGYISDDHRSLILGRFWAASPEVPAFAAL
jgi:hypothetical protein